jgi:hypothetical protein
MLKPSTFDINLIYKCPICGDDHWFRGVELVGRPLLHCCGKTFEIKPISNIKINLAYSTSSNKEIFKDAIEILKSYGYSSEEIINSDISAADSTEFIKEFLARQKNES